MRWFRGDSEPPELSHNGRGRQVPGGELLASVQAG